MTEVKQPDLAITLTENVQSHLAVLPKGGKVIKSPAGQYVYQIKKGKYYHTYPLVDSSDGIHSDGTFYEADKLWVELLKTHKAEPVEEKK